MNLENLNYNKLNKDEVNDIYSRLSFADDKIVNVDTKINLIESMYNQDIDLIGYLLTDEELQFFINNFDKNVTPSYISKNLAKIGLYIKDDFGYYRLPLNIKDGLKKGIDNYLENKTEMDDTKIIIYLISGLIREEGMIRSDKLKDYILKYVEITDEMIDVCYTHPLFNRFFVKDTIKGHEYIIPRELYNTNIDFYKFKDLKNIKTYNKLELFNIGKHYFNDENPYYKKALYFPKIAYLLNQIDRAELILFAGSNNYDLDNYLNTYDLQELDDQEYEALDNFVRSLPSFTPCGVDSLFLAPNDSKDLDDIVSLIFSNAANKYGINLHDYELNGKTVDEGIRSLQLKTLENNFDVLDDILSNYNLTDEEAEFAVSLKNFKESCYIVYKVTKEGLILIDKESEKLYLVKLELNSFFRDHRLEKHYANILITNYRKQIVMITYDEICKLTKEEINHYNEVYKINKNKIIKIL